MIPQFNQHGVLPPFIVGSNPADSSKTAPYVTTINEIIQQFGNSHPRREILRGLLKYRQDLRDLGFEEGFQWIDGSFIEDCKSNRQRPPNDIDIVSLLFRPKAFAKNEEFDSFFQSKLSSFRNQTAKEKYKCDAYFVDLNAHPISIVRLTSYWFGLFTHQRDTFLWKGILEVPLNTDDTLAQKMLEEEV